MQIWYRPPAIARWPHHVRPGERVALEIGAWPVEPGQTVSVTAVVTAADGTMRDVALDAVWQRNDGGNSYWTADLGLFAAGDEVVFTLHGASPDGHVAGPSGAFRVAPKLALALLWHQHQPIYRDLASPRPQGSYTTPWVRLHALRDYYSMAALLLDHPCIHLTINLTPALLWQLNDYAVRGATDRGLDLTLTPVEQLTEEERTYVLERFFDAHWHNQIFPHPRYKELFAQRQQRRDFSPQDLRDLQMWFNLCWFGKEFRDGEVTLATGEIVSVSRFVVQGHGYTAADIEAMVADQYKVLRAIVPLHRRLREAGQIEVSTTPFAHPILPLLLDAGQATIDRPGAENPAQFAHLEDANSQVRLAVDYYQRCFGQPPRGMWPAEGAVGQAIIPLLARNGIRWSATDEGVLARSGRWGYRTDDPDVLCQPYRAEQGDAAVSMFFRNRWLSDQIGFEYQRYDNSAQAAATFLQNVKQRIIANLNGEGDRVLTVVLDGENAWGGYRDDGRPFLHTLYGLLEHDADIQTVTFSEYLEGNPARALGAHPSDEQAKVYDLFTGSWIDEYGSAPGVDLGTWIGEAEENLAWRLLAEARAMLHDAGATRTNAPVAFESLYAAEGSDWFWWFGADQDSGADEEFDDLFRLHLKNVYRGAGLRPPPSLDRHIVPHSVLWTFTQQAQKIQPGDRLTVRTNCPGELTWRVDGDARQTTMLTPTGGVMAGAAHHTVTLGPFPDGAKTVRFRFACTFPGCTQEDICCSSEEHVVRVVDVVGG